MDLMTTTVEKIVLKEILKPLNNNQIVEVARGIESVLLKMYDLIPENKRISYGRVHTVKVLSKFLFDKEVDVEKIKELFSQTENWYAKSTALGILSHFAIENYEPYLPFSNMLRVIITGMCVKWLRCFLGN